MPCSSFDYSQGHFERVSEDVTPVSESFCNFILVFFFRGNEVELAFASSKTCPLNG